MFVRRAALAGLGGLQPLARAENDDALTYPHRICFDHGSVGKLRVRATLLPWEAVLRRRSSGSDVDPADPSTFLDKDYEAETAVRSCVNYFLPHEVDDAFLGAERENKRNPDGIEILDFIQQPFVAIFFSCRA